MTEDFENTCAICNCILDRYDDTQFTCNDIRCQRTWEDQVDAAEDRHIEKIKQEQEY